MSLNSRIYDTCFDQIRKLVYDGEVVPLRTINSLLLRLRQTWFEFFNKNKKKLLTSTSNLK